MKKVDFITNILTITPCGVVSTILKELRIIQVLPSIIPFTIMQFLIQHISRENLDVF